jgi:hypothetical protein
MMRKLCIEGKGKSRWLASIGGTLLPLLASLSYFLPNLVDH